MKHVRQVALLGAILAAGVLSACGPKRVQTVPDNPNAGRTLTVLLPDAGSNNVGRAIVSNASGTANLEMAGDSTLVSATESPAVTTLSESEVQRIFGDALNALPPPPQRFTLYFRFESGELTEESRALLPQILKAIKERPAPDLIVIGHTDTMGSAAANFALGRTRATIIRDLLVRAGLDAAVIDVISHGESDPRVQTADEKLEPLNRRVEISVR